MSHENEAHKHEHRHEHHHEHHHHEYHFIVDGTKYEWPHPEITGEQIRKEASIPDTVDLFLKRGDNTEVPVKKTEKFKLEDHGLVFATDAVGSSGG